MWAKRNTNNASLVCFRRWPKAQWQRKKENISQLFRESRCLPARKRTKSRMKKFVAYVLPKGSFIQKHPKVTNTDCVHFSFESDASKLEISNLEPPGVDVSEQVLGQMISPCRCTGSIGFIHKGCLLLEIQFRRVSTCQMCKGKYRYVQVRRTQSNSLLSYISKNVIRSLATLLYFIAIPLLTTLWFFNRLKFCNDPSQEWSNSSHRMFITNYGDVRRGSKWEETLKKSNTAKPDQGKVHPFVVMVFAYHADVVWINVVNLLMIQLIMMNLEHYQSWCVEHRPRSVIFLTDP